MDRRVGRLEGVVEQLDRRLESIERAINEMSRRLGAATRWMIGLLLASLLASGWPLSFIS